MRYSGTSRTAYLPASPEGSCLLEGVIVAFKQRLCFTIGTSLTTQQDNQVIWNNIHFKTKIRGGAANHGYPDPEYLSRLAEELRSNKIEIDMNLNSGHTEESSNEENEENEKKE